MVCNGNRDVAPRVNLQVKLGCGVGLWGVTHERFVTSSRDIKGTAMLLPRDDDNWTFSGSGDDSLSFCRLLVTPVFTGY